MSFGVSLTFDVDAETIPLHMHRVGDHRLSARSDARFGIVRGLPRILACLAEHELTATFYVPGDTARRYPEAIAAVVEAGHEVGHHGDRHLDPGDASAEDQRAEIEGGLASLAALGIRPRGYRAPSWEVTPITFALLVEHGFEWDSSFMGDDRPYTETHDGRSLLEFPVHWSLDDWVYVGWSPFGPHGGGAPPTPDALLAVWTSELRAAAREARHITLTMHPEITGRAFGLELLESLIDEARTLGAWIAPHGQLCDAVREAGA
jgi:peptidoglycan/xylan/chitin deacetylase (PgdA/CDA1 family)